MTILRAALLSVRLGSTAYLNCTRAAEAWAWALDEARWHFRDVYAIDTHRPIVSHL